METDPISSAHRSNIVAGAFDSSGYLVAEYQRKRSCRRSPCTVVRIGVADACCSNANENIPIAELGNGDVVKLDR
jgi:hypothetical protein